MEETRRQSRSSRTQRIEVPSFHVQQTAALISNGIDDELAKIYQLNPSAFRLDDEAVEGYDSYPELEQEGAEDYSEEEEEEND